jgi:magnesium chelatase subunit H
VVPVSIIEAFTKEVNPQSLESVLRLEYRSKLLNPKWAKAMAAQGSGGAYEISQRMTALVGWSSTAGFKEKFVYDGVCETYVQDEEMARTLMENNPEAFRNVVKRMLEANGRGYWKAGPKVLEVLKELYAEAEDEIELSGGKGVRNKVLRGEEKEGGVLKSVGVEKTPVAMR